MFRSTLLLFAGMISAGQVARATAPSAETSATARKAPAGLDARIWEVTDTVLDHHIDPPTRQEMILAGLKGLYRAAGVALPANLARRVSALSGREQLAPQLDEAWSLVPSDKIEAPGNLELGLEDILIESLLGAVPGGARVLSARDLKVEEQFAGNRYVGLQIALGFNAEAKRVAVFEVLKGGPAERAGVREGDLIEEIDGAGTEGQAVSKVVERLRGAEGSQVVIRVRQPNSDQVRVLTVTRGVLSRKTVKGVARRLDGSEDVLMAGTDSIGYVKIEEILGSTPHELRVLARQLEEQGAKAVILDLRTVRQAHLHPTVLVADSLLEEGTIGRVRETCRVETFRAEPDALFRGWPLAVLVDDETPPLARWLAAALQDNHRAIIVGRERARSGVVAKVRTLSRLMAAESAHVRTAVPVGDGAWSIEMATGRLERGDGRPLVDDEREDKGGLVPDVLVARPSPSAAAERSLVPGVARPDAREAPETDGNPRGDRDPLLAAALDRLRALLKAP